MGARWKRELHGCVAAAEEVGEPRCSLVLRTHHPKGPHPVLLAGSCPEEGGGGLLGSTQPDPQPPFFQQKIQALQPGVALHSCTRRGQ